MSIIIYLYVRVYRYTIYVYIVYMHMYIHLKHTYITLPFTKVHPKNCPTFPSNSSTRFLILMIFFGKTIQPLYSSFPKWGISRSAFTSPSVRWWNLTRWLVQSINSQGIFISFQREKYSSPFKTNMGILWDDTLCTKKQIELSQMA